MRPQAAAAARPAFERGASSTLRARAPASSGGSRSRAGRSSTPTANALRPTQRALARTEPRGHVYPGGALVLCGLVRMNPRETTEVIRLAFWRENFERGLIPAAYEGLLTEAGDVLVPPGLHGRDGFYIAPLRASSVSFFEHIQTSDARRFIERTVRQELPERRRARADRAPSSSRRWRRRRRAAAGPSAPSVYAVYVSADGLRAPQGTQQISRRGLDRPPAGSCGEGGRRLRQRRAHV